MKVATWNVNSIRARLERLLRWLEKNQPDVLCLQELKCTEDQFPYDEIKNLGYQAHVFGQKTYNGVALVSKTPGNDVQADIEDDDEDTHARTIAGTFQGIRIVSVYAPNGQEVNSEAYQYKLKWYSRLENHLAAQKHSEWIVCGDFNIAPEDIDVYDPQAFEGQTLFSEPEKKALASLTQRLDLVDVFRQFHPEPNTFSWWDYRMLGFPKNHGLRIDHLWVSRTIAQRCTAVEIDREERKGSKPSDHAPVWLVCS